MTTTVSGGRVGIPLWVLANSALDAVWIPVAIGINGVIVALAQGPVARVTTEAPRAWAGWAACAAGLVLVFALLRYASSDSKSLIMVLAVLLLVQTAVELLHTSATLWLSFAAARETHLALDLSVVNLGGQLQNIAGPVLVAAVVSTSASGSVATAITCVALSVICVGLVRQTLRTRGAEALIQERSE